MAISDASKKRIKAKELRIMAQSQRSWLANLYSGKADKKTENYIIKRSYELAEELWNKYPNIDDPPITSSGVRVDDPEGAVSGRTPF